MSLHRLLTAVWTQQPGTTEIGDSGVDNTRGHYIPDEKCVYTVWAIADVFHFKADGIILHRLFKN